MQDTNLKISPYFDDFDSSKNYQKVLFKPGYSVQTRELNTVQSILQNQIEKFGQHVFKDGSLVIPGNVNYNLQLRCVLVQPTVNGIAVENYRENLVGKILTGVNSGVKAEVVQTISAEESEKDYITLYVSYNYGGVIEDGVQVKEFKNNEALIDSEGVAVALTAAQNASSYMGSTANINPGVYFVKGFFVEVNPQLILLEQYSSKPSCKVGLSVIESIETVNEDESLYDNSIGSTNYASPGADRLKIDLKLVKQDLLFSDESNFIELLRFEDGNIVQSANAYFSAYNELEKNLARRTYSNHGSFTTLPYTIKLREALNDGQNGGVYYPNEITYDGKIVVTEIPPGATPDIGTNIYSDGQSQYILGKDYYAIELSEGKAYVNGFEVLNERKQITVVPKPRSTRNLNNQGLILNIGSYIKIDRTKVLKGTVSFNDTVLLKDTDGTVIGRARALGLNDYKLYLADLTIYEKITLSSVNNITSGDFLTGSSSGATAFVESVSGSVVSLRQLTGEFLKSETVLSSRFSTDSAPSITNVTKYLLENVRTIDKTGFSAKVDLDSISISGSSFTVSGGTTLTGINTAFAFELSEKSTLLFPGQSAVEVGSVGLSEVTLSSSVANSTYYNVSKLVCKLYSSNGGLTARASLNPVKSGSDYIHHRLIVDTSNSVDASGGFVIQSAAGTVIDKNSIIITSNSNIVDATLTQNNSTTVVVSDCEIDGTAVPQATAVTVYYTLRISNPTIRTKTRQSYKFLLVDKEKDSSNHKYGTRITDREISLKYPDVIKVHAIHQAVRDNDEVTDMFDSLVLNDTSSLNVGDLITSGMIKARVISVSGNNVYLQYISSAKFQSGENLAISIDVPTNSSAVGLFIKESKYGRYVDVTDDFKFVRNDNKDFYDVSKLVRKSSAAEPNMKLAVVYDFFTHDNLSNDFYSVSSYDDLTYDDIPLAFNYTSMADLIDFRYYKKPSSSTGTSGTVNSPYKETASAFDSYLSTLSSGQKVPAPSTVFGLDYNFYLGRVDQVYLTTSSEKYGYITGVVRVIQGSDSIEPVAGKDKSSDGLLLATIKLPPYLKNISEAQIKLEKTRNYTMKDIGKLEDRLSNVEKYTSLSLLEVSTNNLNILDEEGRNRFKNGFVVDSFTTTDVADLANPDYTASIDLDKNIVRPYPYVNNTGFSYDADSSTTIKGKTYITIPYEEFTYIDQPYSSRVENLFPYEVFSWIGNMEVFPKKDIWYDTQREIVEGQNINLVDAYTALFDLVVPGGQIWGNWQLGAGGSSRGGGGTTIVDIREGTQYDVSSLNFEIESGDTIQNIQDIRYSRSRIININATVLKPNTKFYFYINDVEASDIIYPKLLTKLTNNVGKFLIGEQVRLEQIYDDEAVNIAAAVFNPIYATVIDPTLLITSPKTSDFNSSGYTSSTTILAIDQLTSADGSDINPAELGNRFSITGVNSGAYCTSLIKQDLVSDEFGNLNAFVLIPPETFETGELTLAISDLPGNLQIKGLTNSYATGVYYSQGTELNVTSNLITLEAPELTATAIQQERTRFIPDPPPPPAGHDPLAQSFFVDALGICITSIDLYFVTKDPVQPVTIDIRTVENGNPTGYIVPGSIVTVQSKDVKISTDATLATKFKFDNPLYLSSNNDYAFIVRTTNKNYNLWVSRLGETDVTTGLFIDKQPYVGVLYKSANQSIWTPDQYEDIKFKMNIARFETNTTFTAVLPNKNIPKQKLIKNPLKFTQGSSTIRVFQPNHGMHQIENRVELTNVVSDTSNATLSTTISGTATTIALKDVTGANFTPATIEGWSKINNENISDTNKGYIKIGDEIISYTGITNNQLTGCTRGQNGTTAVSHTAGKVVKCFQLNGILLSQLNTIHKVSKVISLDEYEIVVENFANRTKKSGGSRVKASRNIQYENLTPNFNIFTPPNTEATLSITSVSGTSIGNDKQESFVQRGQENIENYVENLMNEPKLVLSKPNMDAFQTSSDGSLMTYINLSTVSGRVSPMIDLDGSSITLISNRINKEVDSNGNIDISSELTPTGGKHSCYITKKVVLETSSTSVKVLFEAIRTPVNDIKVFVKIKGDSSPGAFDEMNYVEIPAISYPASENKKQFRAFDFEIKSLREFQEFSVKVVMIGNDQSDVPVIRNFRALALAL